MRRNGQLYLPWGRHGIPERVFRDKLRVRVLSRLLRCLMMWLILCPVLVVVIFLIRVFWSLRYFIAEISEKSVADP